jgi:hypothetical protein
VADGRREPRYFAAAGFGGAMAVANELPALMLLVLTAGVAFAISPRRAAWAYALPALAVLAAMMGTNYLAHGSWRPPYAHRHDGPIVGYLQAPAPTVPQPHNLPDALRATLKKKTGIDVSPQVVLTPRSEEGKWMLWDETTQQRFAVRFEGDRWEFREWDDWYDYERSYWTAANKAGVDRGESSRAVYAFHMLIGHHGIFSLTPVWLLALAGIWWWSRQEAWSLRLAAWAVAGMTLVCIVFYIARPEHDRNYGGVSCGFRWLLWLIPFWLFCLIPAADAAARHRKLWYAAVMLLAISAFSAYYAANNPWSHPWLFDYWTALGWINY